MKLSRLYSNIPEIFTSVDFNHDVNVVFAEIRVPENLSKDTHNLGKTTLGKILDFCLLAKRKENFFLFKHYELFKNFVFFLEIELLDGGYVTIRRSVADASKASFKRHLGKGEDFSDLDKSEWDHFALPFEKSKALLDGILNLSYLKPWSYRKEVGYLIRTQDDYTDLFQLRKFVGKHAEWKPFIAHIMGFNSDPIEKCYSKEEELSEKQAAEEGVRAELGGSVDSTGKVDGLLLLKQAEADKKQALLDRFDFREEDQRIAKTVVDDIDSEIGGLNSDRYMLLKAISRIESSLADNGIIFNPDAAFSLFKEAGVLFGEQIKRDYSQLVEFNLAITAERKSYLSEEMISLRERLTVIEDRLKALNEKRVLALEYLVKADVFKKYKKLSEEIVVLRADIIFLERLKGSLKRLQELRNEIRDITKDIEKLQIEIEKDVDLKNTDKGSLFSRIRIFFSEIVEAVIDHKALLSVTVNAAGHLEFKAEILDGSGNATSADGGYSYKKLLCIAFDMAILRAHLDRRFPRFAFHDGVFESLDDRKKQKLMTVIREYSGLGIQQTITLIASDVPNMKSDDASLFEPGEIVLRLHDEDDTGRLFRMREW